MPVQPPYGSVVRSEELEAGAVVAAALGADAVTEPKIGPEAVDEDSIKAKAVTTAKLAAGAGVTAWVAAEAGSSHVTFPNVEVRSEGSGAIGRVKGEGKIKAAEQLKATEKLMSVPTAVRPLAAVFWSTTTKEAAPKAVVFELKENGEVILVGPELTENMVVNLNGITWNLT